MRLIGLAIALILVLMSATVSYGQSQNTDSQPPASKSRVIILRLGGDQIGTVKTAEKLSTRLEFREPVKEIICGDLYDATSGTGSFVVQRIDNDVFIKPVVPKGESNMFVKAGERGEHTYNLSLIIVPTDQAFIVVKVIYASENVARRENLNTPRPAMGPPITPRIGSADFSLNDCREGVLFRLQNNWECSVTYAKAISGSPLRRSPAPSATRRWEFTSLDDADARGQSLYKNHISS